MSDHKGSYLTELTLAPPLTTWARAPGISRIYMSCRLCNYTVHQSVRRLTDNTQHRNSKLMFSGNLAKAMSCNQPKAILPSNSGATSRPSEPESSIPTTFVVVGQFPSKPTEARSKSLSGTPPKFVVQQVSGKNNRNVARAMSVLPCIITRGMSSVEGSFDSSVTNLKTFRSLDTISACVPAKGEGSFCPNSASESASFRDGTIWRKGGVCSSLGS